MLAPSGSLRQTATEIERMETKFSAPLEIFQCTHRVAICTWFSNFPSYLIIHQNYAGNKQKSYKFKKMQVLAILDKENPDTGNIKGLNLAAVKHTTVQVTAVVAVTTNGRTWSAVMSLY
jgi:hypothetical protein